MNIFFRKTDRRQVEDLKEQLLHQSKLILDLNDRLTATEKPLRDILVEWDDYYEKFRNLYGRIAKRQQREVEEQKAEAETPNGVAALTKNPLALQLLQNQQRGDQE